MQGTKNLVLATHLENGRWENPIPGVSAIRGGVGHDQAGRKLSRDGVTRQIPLEQRTTDERHWSLALEAFRAGPKQSASSSRPRICRSAAS